MRFRYLVWVVESIMKDESLSDHEKKLVLLNLLQCLDVEQ